LGGDDYAYGIAVDASGNVYVTGASKVLEGHYDFVTIKYSQSLDLPLTQNPGSNNDIPTEFKLYDNFPNPFNPLTKIRFDIPVSLSGAKDLIVKLVIYDLLGREVSVLINNEIKPGMYEIEWNASSYTSGVFFFKLIAGSYIETKKMILIK